MATASVTNTFVTATTLSSSAMNTNFADLVSFLNNSVVHRDGSKSMTADLNMGGNDLTSVGTINARQVAGGLITVARKTADQAGISTITDVSGLSVTWSAVQGRIYRVQAFVRFTMSGASGLVYAYITDTAPNTHASAAEWGDASSLSGYILLTYIWEAPSTASATRKVRLDAATAGTVTVRGHASSPSMIWVEDIGAA